MMRLVNWLRRLWNGGRYGDQHRLNIVRPEGLAEWFTQPYRGSPLATFPMPRGEMDAVGVWIGWPNAPWNAKEGPWSEWSSSQLAACIIRHLQGVHEPSQGLACPLCK